jgi:hypothetical protein
MLMYGVASALLVCIFELYPPTKSGIFSSIFGRDLNPTNPKSAQTETHG